MNKIKITFPLLALLLQVFLLSCKNGTDTEKFNVLFIAVDDLRPELNCYGESLIHSPDIDALAAEGLLFQNSYCNVPVCGASRASLLTGLRPTRNRFLTYYTSADEDAPGVITLPGLFRQNGYHTISNGKVFHNQDIFQDYIHHTFLFPPYLINGFKFISFS